MLLLGLARLKADDTLTLKEKKRKLEALGTAELERWLRAGPLSEAAAKALGFESMAISPVVSATAVRGALELRNSSVEYWQRIPLLPGLELMLRADARDAARLAAQRICEEYVVLGPPVS
jgi:hypothetical protein